MKYYLISKTDKTFKSNAGIVLAGGYNFKQRLSITLYDANMINYILNKKIKNSLKSIISLYLLYEDGEDDGDSVETLLPKIEVLRRILIEKYALYLSEGEIESYLTKCDKLEAKIANFGSKKSKSM